jgi:hypothetical protein
MKEIMFFSHLEIGMFRRVFLLMLACISCGVFPAQAWFQLELKDGLMGGQDDSITHIPSSWMQGSLSGEFPLYNDLKLIISDDLNGAWKLTESNENAFVSPLSKNTRGLPFGEQTINPSNDGYIGMRYKGLDMGYRNIAFIGSDSIRDYLPTYFGFKDTNSFFFFDYRRLVRHVFEGQFNLEQNPLILDISTRYFVTENRVDSLVPNAMGYYDSIQGSTHHFDEFFYSTLRAGIRVPGIGMNTSLGTTILKHISTITLYDSYNYFYLIDGNWDLAGNHLAYQLQGDYQYLERSAFETGFYQTIYLRDFFTLSRGLTMKGLAIATFGKNIFKQRYEIAIRKCWSQGSSADAGFFTTISTWFPKIGLYGLSTIRFNEQFSIAVHAKGIWDLPREYADPAVLGTSFYDFVSGEEFLYKISRPVELSIGSDQLVYYQRGTITGGHIVLDFPSRYTVYCGVRVCAE